MSLLHRRILYISCIIIFFIFTPIIVIYAMGYRYNFKKNKFEKTGLLSIETRQDDVHIYINDELYEHKVRRYSFIPKAILSKIEYPTNVKISLLPDEYNIRLEKEGYWNWKNTISVYPNYTTFVTPIILFKKSVPSNLKNGAMDNILSANRDNIQVLKYEKASTTLLNLNLGNLNENKIYESSKRIKYFPSPNNQRILISADNNYEIIDPLSDKNIINLTAIIESKIENVKWKIG